MIAMGNWTPTGFVGQMFKITASHVPPPPGLPSPLLWGNEKVVTERLGGKTRLKMSRQELLFDYAFAPSEVVAFFRNYFGPTQMTFTRLDEAGQKALAADLTAHWSKNNQGDPKHTVIKAEYLEVHATVVSAGLPWLSRVPRSSSAWAGIFIGHRNTGLKVDSMKLADRWGLSTVEVWFPRKKTPAQAELGRGTPASLFSIA